MEILDFAEEAPCCRVCHGESEPDNQLYFPCKCDGSIKYVHQACLEQWLKVTGKSNPKCELCGEPFHFQKVYKSDAPYRITLYDVFLELIPRGWNLLCYAISVVLASFVWAVMLPLFTNWWLKACWCFISDPRGKCFSNIPSFVENQSTEGLVTYWYFGLVDVCIVIAASVISFEVGHTVYKEYTAATNKQKMRFLEKRLAANQLRVRMLQEESLKKERCLFAISDYEALKYEWDLSKKSFEKAVGTHKPSKETSTERNEEERLSDQAEISMPTPSVADRFLMVQSLASDEQYCARLIVKLDTVCDVTEQIAAFVSLRESYLKLHADLQKTNAQCAALIGLLPASYAADQLELASTRVKSAFVHPHIDALGHSSTTEWSESTEELPWYEQDTGIDVDTLEPTLDNLELRVNLLMRRQLREEARQEREKREGHTARFASRYKPTGGTQEQEDEEKERGEVDFGGGAEDLRTDPAFDYAAEWRRLHEVDEEKGEEKGDDSSLVNQSVGVGKSMNFYPNEKHSKWNKDLGAGKEEYTQSIEEMEIEGEGDGDGYEQDQLDFFAGETDDAELEVAQVVENLVSYVEFTHCDIDLDSVSDEEEEEVNTDRIAHDLLDPHAAGIPVLEAANAEVARDDRNNARVARGEGEIDEPRADAAAVEERGILEVEVVNPPPNLAFGVQPLRFNEPFLHVQHMALAYGYVTVFVLIALVVPALLGNFFFSYTALGKMLTSDLHRHISVALDSEESFYSLVKLLEYLEFSLERLEMNTDKELAAQIVLTQLRALMNLAFGYAVYAAVPILGLAVCYVQYVANIDYSGNAFDVVGVVTRQARAVQGMLYTGVKMMLLMFINGVVLPIAVTLMTAKFLNKSLPPYLRTNDLDNPPVLLIFGLFIFSHLFIAHVRHVLYELRQVINKKYLVGILPDSTILEAGAQENVINVHDRVSKLTYSEMFKNTIIRACILLPAFVFGVVLPVRLGHWCFPFANPLMFRLQQVTAEVQIPVEMMLSHIFIPLIVDKLRYKSIAKQVVSGFVTLAAGLFKLEWILEPPAVAPAAVPELARNALLPPVPEVPPQAPPAVPLDEAIAEDHILLPAPVAEETGTEAEGLAFTADHAPLPVAADTPALDGVHAEPPTAAPLPARLPEPMRLFLLVAQGLLLFALLSSWLLHGPLTTGRWLMKVTLLPTHNDLFNYPVGLLLCWGLGFLVQYIAKDIYRNTGAANALRSTAKWLSLTAQMLGVGLLWLGLPPLILGVLLEALFVVPLRVSTMETSYFPFLQNWAFGLIILKAFCKLLLSGLFGELELRNQMEMVMIRGFAHFDATQSLQRVVYPILLHLLDLLLVPYFIARCLCMVTPSYYLRTVMVRYCFHVYIAVVALFHVSYHLIGAVVRLHNEVRDSKYLIGTRLTNRT